MKPALVYDGECPFCANYVALLRLRETWPDLELIDARQNPDHAGVKLVLSNKLRVDDGMALIEGGKIHHGAAAIHELSAYGGPLNRIIFRSRARSSLLYPFLRFGRNAVLKLLGRKKLGF